MTRRSTRSIVLRDCERTRTERSGTLRTCLASITYASGYGRSLAQRRGRGTIGATAIWWHSPEQLLRNWSRVARPLLLPTSTSSATVCWRGPGCVRDGKADYQQELLSKLY